MKMGKGTAGSLLNVGRRESVSIWVEEFIPMEMQVFHPFVVQWKSVGLVVWSVRGRVPEGTKLF